MIGWGGVAVGLLWRLVKGLVGSEVGRLVLVVGVAVVVAGGGLWLYGERAERRGYERGAAEALAEAQKQTDRWINELSSAADRARVRRRVCIDSGGVWTLTDNKCTAGDPAR